MRHVAFGLAGLALVLLGTREAAALDPGMIGQTPVHVDVTEAGSVLYNFDNRNFRPGKADTATDDKWGMFYNRLNLQSSWGKWQLGLRLDSAWFFIAPTADGVAQRMLDHRPSLAYDLSAPSAAQYYANQRQQAAADLSTRDYDIIYPSKYYLGYTTPDLNVTVGDLYAQLGRGLVLSVRKLDELSSDTTVRGARVTGRVKIGDVRLKLTGLGGTLNPLRIDEASGRILSVDPTYGKPGDDKPPPFPGERLAEAGMPRPIDGNGPTYSTDRVLGGEFDIKTRHVAFGSQGARVIRHYPVRGDLTQFPRDNVTNLSQSIGIPDFDGHGAGYVEVAYQHRDHPADNLEARPTVIKSGYAIYGSLSLLERPVTVLVEVKHYRRFFALQPNRINNSSTKEFQLIQYSTPPTTESIWTDTLFNYMNSCVTGGRVRTDVEASDNDTLFAWVGRYDTWAASSGVNLACDTSDRNLDRVWDVAVGLEKTADHHRSRASITVGARDHEANHPFPDAHGNLTSVYYRENYVRYDIIEYISGPFSLQLQGWHRHRIEPQSEGEAWFEGEHLTGFQWAPHIVVAVGVEYDTRSSTADMYYNARIRYSFNSSSSLSAFIGERRGSLRCVSGVCRVYPPFEGARLNVTARF